MVKTLAVMVEPLARLIRHIISRLEPGNPVLESIRARAVVDKTIPTFETEQKGPIAFMHLDADTYESTSFALKALSKKIVAGSILVFDEHHGYPNWQNGEFRAWHDHVKTNNLTFQYIGFSEMAAAVQILDS